MNMLKVMVEGQTEYDREARLLEELRLQDAHDEVNRLRKEQETSKKLKGKKKKKKAPSRSLRDEQRAAQRRAEAEKLVARLEAERVERAGEEEDDDERTDSGPLATHATSYRTTSTPRTASPASRTRARPRGLTSRATCGRCRRTRRWWHCGLWCDLRHGRS